ncbi:MAG: sugar dehydrogenase complex small subunit [Janthinobacterium lividum]
MSHYKQEKTPSRQVHAERGRGPAAVVPCPSRRTFLAAAAGATLAALACSPLLPFIPRAHAAESAAGGLSAAFLRLSMFVTGQRDLHPETSGRYLAALSKRDPDFPAKFGALLTRIDQAKFIDMDAFLAAAPADAPLLATASRIVSAWYLGIVGDAADAELITYADALMYRPTRGVLAVPTYGPGPLAWGAKPALA